MYVCMYVCYVCMYVCMLFSVRGDKRVAGAGRYEGMISGASRSYDTLVGVSLVCDVSDVGGRRMVCLLGGSVVFILYCRGSLPRRRT